MTDLSEAIRRGEFWLSDEETFMDDDMRALLQAARAWLAQSDGAAAFETKPVSVGCAATREDAEAAALPTASEVTSAEELAQCIMDNYEAYGRLGMGIDPFHYIVCGIEDRDDAIRKDERGEFSPLLSCLCAWRMDEATDEQLCRVFDNYMKARM